MNGKMTAAVLYGKEDVKIERVPIPRVEEGEVLVKVQVALTCGTDLKVYQRGYHARMIVPPALFGHELAGVIEEVGEGVHGFKKGMRVVALNSAPCQMCFYCSKHQENLCEDLLFNNGAYAEYIRVPRRIVEANMLVIPPNVSFEDAAMTEPLACVLRGLHETKVEIGDTVAIIGGGPIGLMFVQVARAIGCNVISVVKRDEQVVAAKHMGAHEIVQFTKVQNVVEAVRVICAPEAWLRRRGRGRGPARGLGVGCRDGAQRRRGQLFRRMRQRNQGAARYQSPALLRDDAQGHLPSHTGDRAPRLWSDRSQENPSDRLHHRGGAALAPATGTPAHAEPRRRHQDRHHSRPLSSTEKTALSKRSVGREWTLVILSEAKDPMQSCRAASSGATLPRCGDRSRRRYSLTIGFARTPRGC